MSSNAIHIESEMIDEIKRLMKEAGLKKVQAQYSGEGDSGSCHVNTPIGFEHCGAQLETLESLVYDLLEDLHEGWEIDEGSEGDLTFALSGDKLKIDNRHVTFCRVRDTATTHYLA